MRYSAGYQIETLSPSACLPGEGFSPSGTFLSSGPALRGVDRKGESRMKAAQSLETVTRRRLLQAVGVGGVALALGARPGRAREDDRESKPEMRTRLTESFGLQHAFVGAGMGFVALPELVAAVSEAGGLGVLGVAPEPPPVFAERITQIRALTSRPFGVDFFLAVSPTLGPITVDGHIEIAAASGLDLAVFHFGIPTAAWVASLKASGSAIWVQVPSVEQARAALDARADGLVVPGNEARGHNRSTTPLHHLLRDVRDEVGDAVLMLAAGGIATGADGWPRWPTGRTGSGWVRGSSLPPRPSRIRSGSAASSRPRATTRSSRHSSGRSCPASPTACCATRPSTPISTGRTRSAVCPRRALQ